MSPGRLPIDICLSNSFQQHPKNTNLWWKSHKIVKILLKIVSLLDASVKREGLWMSHVLQGLLVSGGLGVYVHRKVGALHFTRWWWWTAARVLRQMMQLVQRACSTFHVFPHAQEEVWSWGDKKALPAVAIRRISTGRGVLSHRMLLRVVVMAPFPGVIHVLITNPPVTVLILKVITVRPAELHWLTLVKRGSLNYRKLIFGYSSIHVDQIEHGDNVRCNHELFGQRVLSGTAHLVLEEGGWEGRVQAGCVEEQAAELGQVHQVKASTQRLAQVLVGHGGVLGVQLFQDPNQEQRILWEGVHGCWMAGRKNRFFLRRGLTPGNNTVKCSFCANLVFCEIRHITESNRHNADRPQSQQRI